VDWRNVIASGLVSGFIATGLVLLVEKHFVPRVTWQPERENAREADNGHPAALAHSDRIARDERYGASPMTS